MHIEQTLLPIKRLIYIYRQSTTRYQKVFLQQNYTNSEATYYIPMDFKRWFSYCNVYFIRYITAITWGE